MSEKYRTFAPSNQNKAKDMKYIVKVSEDTAIKISKGNIKIGRIANFNLIPTTKPVTVKGKPITDIKGTCGKVDCRECSRVCYAVHSMQQHHNVIVNAWGTNTLMLRQYPERVESQLNAFFVLNPSTKVFRFHSAGEIESVSQFGMYCRVAKSHPEVRFYIYTKAFGLLSDYIRGGGVVPENFIINLSEWHGNITRHLKREGSRVVRTFFQGCNIFSYYDGSKHCMRNSKSKTFTTCPAVDKKGHETGVKCQMCGKCYKGGSMVRVYPH